MAKKTTRRAPPAQPRMSAEDRKWRARSDLDTLRQAEEIKMDRGRMGGVQREMQNQMAALGKVQKTVKSPAKGASKR